MNSSLLKIHLCLQGLPWNLSTVISGTYEAGSYKIFYEEFLRSFRLFLLVVIPVTYIIFVELSN